MLISKGHLPSPVKTPLPHFIIQLYLSLLNIKIQLESQISLFHLQARIPNLLVPSLSLHLSLLHLLSKGSLFLPCAAPFTVLHLLQGPNCFLPVHFCSLEPTSNYSPQPSLTVLFFPVPYKKQGGFFVVAFFFQPSTRTVKTLWMPEPHLSFPLLSFPPWIMQLFK